jgi:hypothetical protein
VRAGLQARWCGVALLALLSVAEPSRAMPTASTVQAKLRSIARVVSSSCSSGSSARKAGTSFVVEVAGSPHLITALHVVAGCTAFNIEYSGHSYPTRVLNVFREADLAELAMPAVPVPALSIGTAFPAAGTDLVGIGFGGAVEATSKSVRTRLSSARTTIAAIVKSEKTAEDLERQGFPSLRRPVIDIEGGLFAGDSGAPLIDDAGSVVGVANGCLMQGVMPFSWAFPASEIPLLVASRDNALPATAQLSDVLVGDEVASALGPEAPATFETVTCGAVRFVRAGVQTFRRLVDSADPFSANHIGFVAGYANGVHSPIPPDARFDVYVDRASGANFAIPQGLPLRERGRDCVALDRDQAVLIAISGDRVSSFQETTPPAMEFSRRLMRPGEMAVPNPSFSTPPVQRVDGMWVQRWAEIFQPPADGRPHDTTQAFFTFAYRDGVLLEVAARSLFAQQGNRSWFPTLAGVYSASFKLR